MTRHTPDLAIVAEHIAALPARSGAGGANLPLTRLAWDGLNTQTKIRREAKMETKPLNERRFTTLGVAKAAGLQVRDVHNHMARELILGHRKGDGGEVLIAGGGRSGVARDFSFHALMQVAVAAALSRTGMATGDAYRAAVWFAHTGGEEAVGWAADPSSFGPDRRPGFPYHFRDGVTYLAARGGEGRIFRWNPADGGEPFRDALLRMEKGAVIIDALALFDQVCSELDTKSGTELDALYPASADA